MMESQASKEAIVVEVCVKSEHSFDLEGVCIKSEPSLGDTCVKDEPSCSDTCVKDEPSSPEVADARSVSDHVVKDELVLGPELVQPRRVLCTAPEPQNKMPAPHTLNRKGSTVHKRTRLPDSESDGATSPAKRIVIGSTPPTKSPVKRFVKGRLAGNRCKRVVVGRSAPVMVSSQPAQPLTAAIREKRFTNMLEMFPEIHLLFIKNTLVKHGWNEERSRDELLKYDKL